MPVRPLKARYIGYVKGTENHGDESLLWLIRDLLAPEIEVVINDEPCDIALLGGGTLINQSPWLIDWFGKELNRTGRGFTFGTGVGDIAFWGNHFKRWVPLLERCDFVSVRGPDSSALLRDHGLSQVSCIGDPYLWLRAPVPSRTISKRLGVNLGSTNNSLWGGNDRDFFDFMITMLLKLKAEEWTFTWISVWSKDLPFVESVRQAVDPDSPPVLDARSQTLEVYSSLAACDVFAGEKLHANAMAAVAGVPFLSFEYQPKVREFAESLDVASWVCSTGERDAAKVARMIEHMRENRAVISEAITRKREELRGRIAEFVREIKDHYGAQPLVPQRER